MVSRNSKIFIAGHKGLVGSAILRGLKKKGYKNLITKDKSSLDLLDQKRLMNTYHLEKKLLLSNLLMKILNFRKML